MLFRQQLEDNQNKTIVKKIRNELNQAFKNKGVNISEIEIDIKSGNLNVSVCIKEK